MYERGNRGTKKTSENRKKYIYKMGGLKSTISITTLNVNGINTLIKRETVRLD